MRHRISFTLFFTTCVFLLLHMHTYARAGHAFLKNDNYLPQSGQSVHDSVEITDTDFTKIPRFNGSHATVFGVALGMGIGRAKEMIAKIPALKMVEDPFNPRRFYLKSDTATDTARQVLGYLKWPNYDTGLYQVVLYPAMAGNLKGLSAAIVGPGCLSPDSAVYQDFLGAPSGQQVTVDMPHINIKTTMYYYPKYNFAIEEDITPSGTQYCLVFTRKWK